MLSMRSFCGHLFNAVRDFALGNSFSAAVKLWYWIDARESFSLSDSTCFGKNMMIFSADISSSTHIDKKKIS